MDNRLRSGITAATAAILVTGCGGGGGASGGGGDPGDPANSLAPRTVFEPQDSDHLLMRTQFGVSSEARAVIDSMGLAAFVDDMLSPPVDEDRPFETAARARLQNLSDPVGLEGMFPSGNDVSEWWLEMMVNTDTPFQERFAMFLHDHFAVSFDGLNSSERHWMVDHIQKLRREGFGNFRDLVLEMARDSAMLEWLDGHSNVNGEPNENFAREFFELFTVGADRGYTEIDVQEASRAFTGYRNRLDAETNLRYSEFDPDRKDIFAKVLFDDVILRSNGETVDDFALVVDVTFEHLRVDEWLAEKLLLEFVSDAPSAALIANFAAVIRAEDYEMRPILRRLFLSEAFYQSRKSMVRMPVDYAVGLIRTTGLGMSPGRLRGELSGMSQVPADPPSVFGWPQGPEWLSAEGLVGRANFARQMIVERTFQRDNGMAIVLPSETATAEEVIDHFASLLDVSLTADERTDLIDYMDSDARNDGSVVEDPFDASDDGDINERVRGLIYILANHVDAVAR
ncbi:MAG: DUF1800 domain-containing protein [Planctomycetota bacterium]